MAVKLAFQRLKLWSNQVVPWPCGALFHGDQLTNDTVIAVASGGNIDDAMFKRALHMNVSDL